MNVNTASRRSRSRACDRSEIRPAAALNSSAQICGPAPASSRQQPPIGGMAILHTTKTLAPTALALSSRSRAGRRSVLARPPLRTIQPRPAPSGGGGRRERLAERREAVARRDYAANRRAQDAAASARRDPPSGLGVYSEAHWTGVGDGGGYRELAAEGPSARKILVLISDTGGGHRASAQAIEAALRRYGRYEVEIVDLLTDHGRWPINQAVPSYKMMARWPWTWQTFFHLTSPPPLLAVSNLGQRVTCYEGFRKCIEDNEPDLVVSDAPDVPGRASRRAHTPPPRPARRIPRPEGRSSLVRSSPTSTAARPPDPFATVVTDLARPTPRGSTKRWTRASSPPTPSARSRWAAASAPPIRQYGLPVRENFWQASDKTSASDQGGALPRPAPRQEDGPHRRRRCRPPARRPRAAPTAPPRIPSQPHRPPPPGRRRDGRARQHRRRDLEAGGRGEPGRRAGGGGVCGKNAALRERSCRSARRRASGPASR